MTKRELTPAGQMRDIKDNLGEIERRENVSPPPDAGWREEVYVLTRYDGVLHTPDFVAETRWAAGVPTWTTINVGLTLPGEEGKGLRGDPFRPGYGQYCLMTDGAYSRVAGGNWVSILTLAAAQAAVGGDLPGSFGSNGMDTSINQDAHVGILYNARDTGLGGRAVYFVSDDYGATWTWHSMFGWSIFIPEAHSLTIGALRGSSPYAAGQVMYAAGKHGVHVDLRYSTDGGVTWGSTFIGGAIYDCHILVDPNDQSRVFVGMLNGAGPWNVGVSLDHGATVAQYDANASEDLGYGFSGWTYYHLSVAMDSNKMVRVGAATARAHIHTTRDDGGSWEEPTPEFSSGDLGISIVQDAPNFLYLLRRQSGNLANPPTSCHVIWASDNEGRDMMLKSGANACTAGTGGGDSIAYDCGGIRGILQIWTDRAEGDIPGVPSPRDIGQFPGVISPEQLVPHDILSVHHSDTLAAAVSRGSVIVGNATPAWSELVIGAADLVLLSDGVDVAWGPLRAITVNDAAPGLTITQAGAGASLSLPTATTAAKGLILGADVHLYRSAANILRLNDHFLLERDAGLSFYETAHTNDIFGPYFNLRKSRGTEAIPVVVANGDILGSIQAWGWSAAAASWIMAARIFFRVDGVPDSGADPTDMPGRIDFQTVPDGSATLALRMRVASHGGIFMYGLKSGATQVAAGAAVDELWHDTDDDTIKLGV